MSCPLCLGFSLKSCGRDNTLQYCAQNICDVILCYDIIPHSKCLSNSRTLYIRVRDFQRHLLSTYKQILRIYIFDIWYDIWYDRLIWYDAMEYHYYYYCDYHYYHGIVWCSNCLCNSDTRCMIWPHDMIRCYGITMYLHIDLFTYPSIKRYIYCTLLACIPRRTS